MLLQVLALDFSQFTTKFYSRSVLSTGVANNVGKNEEKNKCTIKLSGGDRGGRSGGGVTAKET